MTILVILSVASIGDLLRHPLQEHRPGFLRPRYSAYLGSDPQYERNVNSWLVFTKSNTASLPMAADGMLRQRSAYSHPPPANMRTRNTQVLLRSGRRPSPFVITTRSDRLASRMHRLGVLSSVRRLTFFSLRFFFFVS